MGFVSFVDMIGFRREIQILLRSWEVEVRVTAKIIFVHVYSRTMLQKEDVLFLVNHFLKHYEFKR